MLSGVLLDPRTFRSTTPFTNPTNPTNSALQGRQFPVEVMYTAAPEDSYVDAAITAALQVTWQLGAAVLLRAAPCAAAVQDGRLLCCLPRCGLDKTISAVTATHPHP